MKIYVDPTNGYKVSAAPALGCIAAEDTFFDNECPNLIESYRYVPAGATWTREDGVAFAGPMIALWRDIRQYDGEQREYERQQLAQYESALSEIEAALGVNA
nr:MAG TPA: hypothetical protein [Caudoviricetes sp.]